MGIRIIWFPVKRSQRMIIKERLWTASQKFANRIAHFGQSHRRLAVRAMRLKDDSHIVGETISNQEYKAIQAC